MASQKWIDEMNECVYIELDCVVYNFVKKVHDIE